MKKVICVLILVGILLTFSSCECEHDWKEATCTSPKTCKLCGQIEGKKLEHSWLDATCVAPQTCSLCGETQGTVAYTHNYVGDKCIDCGLIQLTLYNYDDYLDCDAVVKVGDSIYYNSTYGYLYTSAECSFEAKGNAHYKYNNVSIVVEFSHYDLAGYRQYLMNRIAILAGGSITEEAIPYSSSNKTVKLSIAGNGKVTCDLSTPWNKEKSAYSETDAVFDRTYYEVVSVSGTVEEY